MSSAFDFDLVIKNGIVVSASDETRCDIAVKDGKVVLLMRDVPVPEGCEVIDVDGGYVTVSFSSKLFAIPTKIVDNDDFFPLSSLD
jgi:N-acyl-D-aspartate/D-glutamate deacylase